MTFSSYSYIYFFAGVPFCSLLKGRKVDTIENYILRRTRTPSLFQNKSSLSELVQQSNFSVEKPNFFQKFAQIFKKHVKNQSKS